MEALQPHQKVFGIGLSKTGTTSLTKALNLLGIPSIHFPHDDRTFSELQRGEYRLSVLEHYQGVTDTPVAPFYAQLDRVWPDSKFILTVREKTSWLRSAEDHWRRMKQGAFEADVRYQDFISACVYGCTYFSAERFAYVYDQHAKNVREHFGDRPNDLLVLDVCGDEGWEPLCSFLGAPVPEGVPFPHANRANEWASRMGKTIRELKTAIPVGVPVVLLDQNSLGENFTLGRVIPFLEQGGEYAGLPSDSDMAIRELERLRREQGAQYLALVWPAFWCLDYYTEFANYLRTSHSCLHQSEHLIVYGLQ